MFRVETGHSTTEQEPGTSVGHDVNKQEYQELITAIDQALARFGGRPAEEGFDLEVYEELCRVRETIIRAWRDVRDSNVRRDSKNPLGQA